MTYKKRKKDTRMRGSHTHGGGDKKKRRGFGHRGGKGNAGRYTGSKKPSAWAAGRKHNTGFISRSNTKSEAINVGDIILMIDNSKFERKGNAYDVNLTALGFTKLLSKGSVKYHINVTVDSATEKAIAKISAAGGSVNINKKE